MHKNKFSKISLNKQDIGKKLDRSYKTLLNSFITQYTPVFFQYSEAVFDKVDGVKRDTYLLVKQGSYYAVGSKINSPNTR
jgi:hypothetical protein